MANYERTAEEQLKKDQEVVSKGNKEIAEMERKRKLFGGGKGHYGFGQGGVSDESYAEKQKETKDYDAMSKQQYQLRKARELKEASASSRGYKEHR